MNNLKKYIAEKFKISKDIKNISNTSILVNRILDIIIEDKASVSNLDELKKSLNNWIEEYKVKSLFFYYDKEDNRNFDKKYDEYFIKRNPRMTLYYSNKIKSGNEKYIYSDSKYKVLIPEKLYGDTAFIEVLTYRRKFIIINND